jgi:GntR family transcriptional repressor for pyruvate dehydrogenase complex
MAMFQAVARPMGLTEKTERHLEELILGNSLQAGDKLPSEKDLGEQLGVSKTVVRESMRSLSAKGLVEVRAGSGTYVRKVDRELMSRPMNLLLRSGDVRPQDIHEARELLEVNIAGLAAERAEPADIAAMAETIEALKSPSITAQIFAETDVAFHRRLAEAARNPLFTVLV